MQQLCRGDEFRSIIVEVYDWNRTQADKLIGSATTCLADLRRASSDGKPVILALYENIEPAAAGQGKKKKKPKCMGQLIVLAFFRVFFGSGPVHLYFIKIPVALYC